MLLSISAVIWSTSSAHAVAHGTPCASNVSRYPTRRLRSEVSVSGKVRARHP
jgi:hypothetical protein